MNPKLLIITICSNGKYIYPFEPRQDFDRLFRTFNLPIKKKITETRASILEMIQSGEWTRNQKPLNSLPYNDKLLTGPEFGEQGQSNNYSPAIVRYAGRYYEKLGTQDERIKKILDSNQHLIILSGLYGILDCLDQIQLYSCSLVDDHPSIRLFWMSNSIITKALLEYCEKNRIEHILDFTGIEIYRDLIDWDFIKGQKKLRVLHAYSKQHNKDSILSPLGLITNQILIDRFSISLNSNQEVSSDLGKVYLVDQKMRRNNKYGYYVDEIDRNRKYEFIIRIGINIEKIVYKIFRGVINPKDQKLTVIPKIRVLADNRIISYPERDLLIAMYDARNAVIHENRELSDEEIIVIREKYNKLLKYLSERHNLGAWELEPVEF
jgi:cytoplasmic iron level regulating protein YaaA (DUF328/UPF0246 family)